MDRPETIQNAGSMVLTDGSGADRGTGEVDGGQYDQREEVFAACGCAVLFNRAMLADVGAFDPTFFVYYEDTDLSWRMRMQGWRVIYEPAAVIEHVHSGTSRESSPFFIFHVDRNRLFMILKNAPPGFVMRAFARLGWMSLRSAARGVLRPWRGGLGGQAATPGADRSVAGARVHVKVLGSLLRHLPEMLAKRRSIRRKRRVSDAEIVHWFYPRERWNTR
jgi:GT2 family glycosyltransferase